MPERRGAGDHRLWRTEPPPQVVELGRLGVVPRFEGGRFLAHDALDGEGVEVRLDYPTLFEHGSVAPHSAIGLGDGSTVHLPAEGGPPELYAAARNLLREPLAAGAQPQPLRTAALAGGGLLETADERLLAVASAQSRRAELIRSDRSAEFAKSAYYMGSKRELAPFLVEAVSAVADADTAIVDLMCGAGAAAKGFSYEWDVLACDLQQFCVTLTASLGRGTTLADAQETLELVMGEAEAHTARLAMVVEDLLRREDELLHAELDERVVREYADFSKRMPRFPDGGRSGEWDPAEAYRRRQDDPAGEPYCLLTAAYANVYFGVRQAMVLDGLRYGIDQVADPRQRDWALAALVATASHVASGFASQFAQPVDPTPERLPDLMDLRARNVAHEFSVRLTSMAAQSELAPREIETRQGRWEDSLAFAADRWRDRDVVVYLDAPYTRDEYGRYYHVLETLLLYNYPELNGNGRLPPAGSSNYPKSPLHTRSERAAALRLAEVIDAVLDHGWTCAWSYSDRGVAAAPNVLDLVAGSRPADVVGYSCPHHYKGQGGRGARKVTEWCFVIAPGGG